MDDLFRDKLFNHSMETPMHLWEAIDAHNVAQAKQAQRRRWFWYWTTGILSLGFLSTLWIWAGQKETTPEPVQTQQKIQAVPPAAPEPSEDNAPTALQEPAKTLEQNLAQTELAKQTYTSQSTTAKQTSSTATTNAPAKLETAKFDPTAKTNSTPTVNAPQNLIPEAENTSSESIASTADSAEILGVNAESDQETTREKWQNFTALDTRPTELEFTPVLDLGEARPLYQPRTRGWRVYGEGFAALDQATRSLEARETEFETYRQAREQTETVQSGFRATLRFSMISIDGIAVRSGLSYSNHRESFTYQQTTQSNSFQTVDIPVVLGYERNNVGKFTLAANAGVYLNMAFNQKGNFLSPDLNRVLDFSSKTPDAYPAFRNNLGVAWYGSIAASYPITPRLRLVLEPYLLHHTGSFTAKDYAIDQRYQNWGIQIGLRKKINKYIYFVKP